MLISVIIPAHNAETTIREALESVEAQTIRQSADDGVQCEIVVVDDASTDGTAEAVRGWAESKYGSVGVSECGSTEEEEQGADGEKSITVTSIHPHALTPILITLPRNAGPAAARNRGIAEAKGEWIAFLDADDAWLPEKLAVQMEMARRQPDVALWCGGVIAGGKDEGGNLKPEGNEHRTSNIEHPTSNAEQGLSDIAHPVFSSGLKSHPSSFRKLRVEEFACGNPVATSTVLIKKAALDAVGGFDEQFRGPEDYELWMRVAARFPVALIETPLARYRQVQGSLSMDDRRFLPEVLRVLDKAYGPGGVLCGLGPKGRAVGYQHLAGAWMAAERGALGRAWALLVKSLLVWPWSYRGAGSGLRWPRLKLVARFASLTLRAGRRERRR